MSGITRLIGVAGAAAIALALGAGQAYADDDHHGWRKKHHRGHHHRHHHHYYEPHRDIVVIERHHRRPPPRPRVIYVEPAPVYSRPEINIVFPLRF